MKYNGNHELSMEIQNRIDSAIHDEAKRTKVGAKFLPLYMATPDAFIVPADIIKANKQPLTINDTNKIDIVEIQVGFALTQQQFAQEAGVMTANSLATRAANLLSQAEDLLLFQGNEGLKDVLFVPPNNLVTHQSGDPGSGLLVLRATPPLPPDQIIDVPSKAGEPTWGETTFEKVADGYARLQDKGHYGPYALALPTRVYADTYAPLADTLIIPADRIKPLVTAGFYGTGTLPDLTGVLLSIGGNSVDLVVGVDTTIESLPGDDKGQLQYRVYERFALRLKDETAVIRLNFIITPPTP
jgi:uncharacterized linocin/CFP29 family protein